MLLRFKGVVDRVAAGLKGRSWGKRAGLFLVERAGYFGQDTRCLGDKQR